MEKFNNAKIKFESVQKNLKKVSFIIGAVGSVFLTVSMLSVGTFSKMQRHQQMRGTVETDGFNAAFAKTSSILACFVWAGIVLKSYLGYKAS